MKARVPVNYLDKLKGVTCTVVGKPFPLGGSWMVIAEIDGPFDALFAAKDILDKAEQILLARAEPAHRRAPESTFQGTVKVIGSVQFDNKFGKDVKFIVEFENGACAMGRLDLDVKFRGYAQITTKLNVDQEDMTVAYFSRAIIHNSVYKKF